MNNSQYTLDESHIPQCPKEASLSKVLKFIDEVSNIFKQSENLDNLVDLFKTAKQLSRSYYDCSEFRTEIADNLIKNDIPLISTKIIKRLNNMGVFSSDNTWFATFYLYNISWNYSECSPKFATLLGIAGLPHLLNLNIGHPPYLDNLKSRNVYFLIKASLCILHNIGRVPGNRDLIYCTHGRDALLSLFRCEDEESLRTVASLCLAHTLTESEIECVTPKAGEGASLLQLLTNNLYLANASTKKKYHGFNVPTLLNALRAYTSNENSKKDILNMSFEPISPANLDPSKTKRMDCMGFLKQQMSNFTTELSNKDDEKNVFESMGIVANLVGNPTLRLSTKVFDTVRWMDEQFRNSKIKNRADPAVNRLMELISWQTSQPRRPSAFTKYPMGKYPACGPLIVSYAPVNHEHAVHFIENLSKIGITVWNKEHNDPYLNYEDAQAAGLSGIFASVKDVDGWLDCLNKASVMVVGLSDAYRLNPGCRAELEYFISTNSESNPKQIAYVIFPPKFTPTGWLANLPGIENAIDFTQRKTFQLAFQYLVAKVGKPYGIDIDESTLPPLTRDSVISGKSYINLDDLQNLTIPSDMVEIKSNSLAIPENQTFGIGLQPKTLGNSESQTLTTMWSKGSSNIAEKEAALAKGSDNKWQNIAPFVRKWNASDVAKFFESKGLGALVQRLPGLDGRLLSQLITLRQWAPEYFANSLRSELGLNFIEGLHLIEVLEELITKKHK